MSPIRAAVPTEHVTSPGEPQRERSVSSPHDQFQQRAELDLESRVCLRATLRRTRHSQGKVALENLTVNHPIRSVLLGQHLHLKHIAAVCNGGN